MSSYVLLPSHRNLGLSSTFVCVSLDRTVERGGVGMGGWTGWGQLVSQGSGLPIWDAPHLSCVCCPSPCPQAYAMMLSLSEDTPLHAPSQSSLDAWLNITGPSSESGAFNPINHL